MRWPRADPDGVSAVTIVLAEGERLVRQGVRRLLELDPDFRVIGEEGDGRAAVALVERLSPDVLILGLRLSGMNGLDVIRVVTQRAPTTRVLVLSTSSNERDVVIALRNGAGGYLLTDADTAELLAAVREIAAGRRYLSAPLTARALEAYVERGTTGLVDRHDSLTLREREVLQLSAEGNSNAEIATRLSISVRTAETHRANLMRKLGLRSSADIVRYAVGRGLIRPG